MKKQLNKTDIKALGELLPVEIDKKDHVEIEDDTYLIINNEPAFFNHEGRWVPMLRFAQKHVLLKQVVVDEGAVKFMANGADVMRPGIVDADPDIEEGEIVMIVDIKNKVGLCIGKTIFDRDRFMEMKGGKVIKNIHHVGDVHWKHSESH
ncbi:MAG: PUA domain-containing protein [Nanoarchaeota archaeon]